MRVLARKPGQDPAVEWVKGDLGTGEGVAEAVAGAQSVVHAATFSPSARRGFLLPSDFFRSPSAVDVDGTSRVIDAAEEAGIEHFLYVSIVGVERTPLPYARLKLIAETLVRRSALPWSVVRATPFYWLVDRMLGNMMRLPVLPLPVDLATQPCDTRDFARYRADVWLMGQERIKPTSVVPKCSASVRSSTSIRMLVVCIAGSDPCRYRRPPPEWPTHLSHGTAVVAKPPGLRG